MVLISISYPYKTKGSLSPPECDEYIRIFEYSNIFDPNIYSDLRSYQNFDTNIFGYSFVSKNSYEYIRIFVRVIFLTRIYSDIHSYQNPYECHALFTTAYDDFWRRIYFFDFHVMGKLRNTCRQLECMFTCHVGDKSATG